MANNNILLSICIPTFNRSQVLRETLESLVTQDVFLNTDAIEIVISDNASSDDTPAVMAEYAQRFPGKIVTYRQPVNCTNENFRDVLSLGRGLYLKLHNDTLLMREGALKPLLDGIGQFAKARPVIAMTNGNRVRNGTNLFEPCESLDQFVQNVSFFSTWIGGFGLWREDLALTSAFQNDASQLAQVSIQCQLVASGRPAVVFFGAYFISKQDYRGSYNWAEVFGKNYLGILKRYVDGGQLSAAVYAQAKHEVLIRHILPSYFNTNNVYVKTGFFDNLAEYHDDDYFYQAIAERLPLLWRLNNPHNQTELRSASHPSLLARVSVGNKSRGGFHVAGSRNSTARLEIGCFVSISENVSFILGEEVPHASGFSNYWASRSSAGDGSIRVGDDVWIGSGALLLSGIQVGQGAVIAAGSVVTEDVPPYTEVAGNPARVCAQRFVPEVIDKLNALDFATLTDDVIAKMGAALQGPITPETVDAFLQQLAAAAQPAEPVVQPFTQEQEENMQEERVPALLILDGHGEAEKVETSLALLADSEQADLPVIVLTTQSGEVPEWTDTLRYIQASKAEFADVAEQLRVLPDFVWVSVIELEQ